MYDFRAACLLAHGPRPDAENMLSRGTHQSIAALAAGALLASAPVASASATPPTRHSKRAHIALLVRNPHHAKRAHIALLVRHGHVHRGCAGANTPATAGPRREMRDAVVCLINDQRVRHHLPPLQASTELDSSAQRWTNAMVSSGQFTHGSNFAARISAAGFHWSFAGENIATGFSTPAQVVRGWMASTGHCQNILNPSFADVGTGVSPHAVRGFATGPSTWTQDFGLWMGHGAPSHDGAPAAGCPYHV
jgi:uncharacterized protein YkwD